ncbi:hypothetical protein PVAP13_8NG030701 [Panicum virgatum]|uniref:Uncharacterized protein n=1 Tax=Panicum virgatum TaxID=38727 RepID=A0A8T0P431_PANVG|nr:hypothetical protein PVAP13_8NG030701 [Panicum virgatum]
MGTTSSLAPRQGSGAPWPSFFNPWTGTIAMYPGPRPSVALLRPPALLASLHPTNRRWSPSSSPCRLSSRPCRRPSRWSRSTPTTVPSRSSSTTGRPLHRRPQHLDRPTPPPAFHCPRISSLSRRPSAI